MRRSKRSPPVFDGVALRVPVSAAIAMVVHAPHKELGSVRDDLAIRGLTLEPVV